MYHGKQHKTFDNEIRNQRFHWKMLFGIINVIRVAGNFSCNNAPTNCDYISETKNR